MPEEPVNLATLTTEEFLEERAKAIKDAKVRSLDVKFADNGGYVIDIFKEGPQGEFIPKETRIANTVEDLTREISSLRS